MIWKVRPTLLYYDTMFIYIFPRIAMQLVVCWGCLKEFFISNGHLWKSTSKTMQEQVKGIYDEFL